MTAQSPSRLRKSLRTDLRLLSLLRTDLRSSLRLRSAGAHRLRRTYPLPIRISYYVSLIVVMGIFVSALLR